ncbi:peptidylprolyl isomerase [Scytonema sp. UIC 10036]|uniref:peptidylprolyl isomerase n=1 Tax=Scytonema sp. UIC 10036 TaxID=2304196 RepID=UPI0012DA2E34|nr:peptidylprolyl isomerase [Scytonema sp. UIC 10036]MUG99580.1 peptidylprolyl isomerase [Scytonema sp. UIC 10036]
MYNDKSYTVNFLGLSINDREIITYLRKTLQLKEICQKIIYQRIIHKAALEQGLIVTPEEIQSEINHLQREQRLATDSDLFVWLEAHLLTADDWKASIRDRLLQQKLAEVLFSQHTEIYFIQHQPDFERVLLYQLIVPYEQLANELFYQISEQEITFYEAAHLYDIDERRRDCCGCEGKIYRYKLKPEIADVVFNASIGELIGPVNTERGSHLFMVEEYIPSELSATVRQEILQQMFVQWIEGQLNGMLQRNNS